MSLADRFRTTLDLHTAGVQMMRLKLRRMHPDESEAQIQARLAAWMQPPLEEIPCHRRAEWPRS